MPGRIWAAAKAVAAVAFSVHALFGGASQATPAPISPRSSLTTTTRPLRPYPGNRTNYPSGLPRNDSSSANPNYAAVAQGNVTVLMPYDRAHNSYAPDLKLAQQAWGEANNVSVHWKDFGPDVDYDAYVQRVIQACASGEDDFDVIWVEASYVGVLADCLIDVWAWSDTLGSDHIGAVARGGVIKDRLVALPAELSFGILLYNMDLLTRYNYYSPPASVAEMEEMAAQILIGEKVMEHQALCGLTGAMFGEPLASMATEWLAGIGAALVNDTGDVTIATTPVAGLFASVINWLQSGILDQADVGTADMDAAIARFTNGNAIFLRTTTSMLPQIMNTLESAWFGWGVAPVPSQLENGLGVGTIDGWFTGVYRHSKNPAAALRTVEWLTSAEYQKQKILKVGTRMVGTFPQFLLDRQICQAYGSVRDVSLCLIYSQVNLARRPIPQTGAKYPNISLTFQKFLLNLLDGNTYIITGLENLDKSLRTQLDLPPRDYSIILDPGVIGRPGKIIPQKVGTQLAGLFLVVGVTALVVFLYRRKQRLDLQSELRASAASVVEAARQGGAPTGESHEMGQVKEEKTARKSKGKEKEEDPYGENTSLIQKSEKIEI
ncbi:uncharacterized protein SPPG_05624 [Spizellomyces punctatus DAOM BR117]|uniref:Uncharacterized protein n=1 Tax=Spizellomyces punctatus (strain DAOM BR117) TaxID=645134 RepID=A0A0L0HD01_SPIPD|nr:uncharacterized protein SPPG_05624 [Spizellomyces punctatus DAOM BR117]KNC99380.1 hypothetical protein SPPG_05624 [Spizellomyces punctatus DAOM BR117]|eukprot:XP_016607420.1 hypothetical protein SPPG_05624 [Spizellomyces punctatus DAOM BR117]